MTPLAPILQAFFTDRLIRQRQASRHTIASYRDTFRLLLTFIQHHHGKQPSTLGLDDLGAPAICAFLDHLDNERHNNPRTRNTRLAAIRSLFRYAALHHPERAALIAQVLAIPQKRFDRPIVPFLTPAEVDALLAAPDLTRWEGRRDRALLLLTVQTGLRVSEIVGLNCADITLGTGGHLRCEGKGRRQRAVPLTTPTQTVLRAWIDERAGRPTDPLFPTRTGRRLSRDAVERRLAVHTASAAQHCPSLAGKRASPHTLRHSCAMNLLQAGVDTSVIALWLGHADVRSTQPYLHADLTIKEKALARMTPTSARSGRYHPPDPLLAFLESL